jgi:hypothetical protein
MLHWRTVGTTVLITGLLALSALGGGFHWRALRAIAGA